MKKPFLFLALITAIALLLPQDAWPQKPEAMRRIGVLGIGKPPSPDAPSCRPELTDPRSGNPGAYAAS